MKQLRSNQRGDSIWDFMSEVERAFDDMLGPQSRTPSSLATRGLNSGATFLPAVDLHESEDGYLVSLDVPGVNEKDVKIDVQQGRLTVSGERKSEERSEKGMFKRVERSYGRFERSFQLPQDIDDGKIQARLDGGVLEIMIPKAEVAKPRSVQIETTKDGLFSRVLGQKKTESASVKAEKGDTH